MAKLKILLVDDERDFLELMSLRIKGWGYEVFEALGGKEALGLLKNKKPDMVILDYKMPGLDGVTTLKEIRKINVSLPVIMFTAYPDAKSIKGAEELKVNVYIPKMSEYSDGSSALKTAVRMIGKKLKRKE